MREAPLVVPRDDNNTEENDVAIIPELQKALFTAEKNCAAGSCSLPATQHLQIRVCITLWGLELDSKQLKTVKLQYVLLILNYLTN